MATGQVARFDPRRGYGFLIPDDGGEDVFVHQNNINMDGFRFLKPGEQVRYELEVSEKGLKAVDVTLTSERQEDDRFDHAAEYGEQEPRERSDRRNGGGYERRGNDRRNGGGYERRSNGGGYDRDRGGSQQDDRLLDQVDKLRRKQERLISLLVSKGVLTPGEVDGLEGPTIPEEAVMADLGDDDI